MRRRSRRSLHINAAPLRAQSTKTLNHTTRSDPRVSVRVCVAYALCVCSQEPEPRSLPPKRSPRPLQRLWGGEAAGDHGRTARHAWTLVALGCRDAPLHIRLHPFRLGYKCGGWHSRGAQHIRAASWVTRLRLYWQSGPKGCAAAQAPEKESRAPVITP